MYEFLEKIHTNCPTQCFMFLFSYRPHNPQLQNTLYVSVWHHDQPTRRYTHRMKKGNELHASVFDSTLFLLHFRFILFAPRSPYQLTALNKTCNTRIATTALYNQSGYLHVWQYLLPTFMMTISKYMFTSHAHIAFVRCEHRVTPVLMIMI